MPEQSEHIGAAPVAKKLVAGDAQRAGRGVLKEVVAARPAWGREVHESSGVCGHTIRGD